MRLRLYSDALAHYVSMFRKHGDVHSALYTGSPAMHGHVLGLVLTADARPYGASASVGLLQNLRVAVQRRWNNSVSDAARQQSMEVFLGLNLGRHAPGVRFAAPHPLVDLTGPDPDDAPGEEARPAHLGAELEELHLRHHDGRLGLQEDVQNLEPPESVVAGGEGAAAAGGDGKPAAVATAELSKDEDVDYSVPMDPLGAVRTPVRGSGGGGRPEAGGGVGVAGQLADLLL